MRLRLIAATLGSLLCVLPADAASIDLAFTVDGVGGLSAPTTDISASTFNWIDTTGTSGSTALTAFGFNPFAAFDYVVDTVNHAGGGSVMVSDAFTLGADETLSIAFRLLSLTDIWFDTTAPTGMALLISDTAPLIVLANINADGTQFLKNQGYPGVTPADSSFTPVSPSVTTTTVYGQGIDASLGAFRYADPDNITGRCGCFLDVASSVTPGAGTYQLVFALYDYEQNSRGYLNAALAVTDVQTTPEPSAFALMSVASVATTIWRRRNHEP
jgi:hypothetical protein